MIYDVWNEVDGDAVYVDVGVWWGCMMSDVWCAMYDVWCMMYEYDVRCVMYGVWRTMYDVDV